MSTSKATSSRPRRAPSARAHAIKERQERAERERLKQEEAEAKQKSQPAASQLKRNKYKDKFYTLREKYDVVNTARETHLREITLAQSKLKKLQAECDLLLDTIALSATGQPSLNTFLTQASPPPTTMDHDLYEGEDGALSPLDPPESPTETHPDAQDQNHSQNERGEHEFLADGS
ncbi:hypothetical protein BOTBODRAFT_170549 [Botryobasidium botryosum FD-172 SS1]|uniref:Uncharacterized protein n=1 Tax=Botryobasidium botryosum (strain FD-172 SS1) TaxID=930990 RepID=A0A067N5P5_BOTB1|nr:hypothetical protein BOTBODRAFT_170549 [Botryobasidium botryosum FD-172 SS1]